MQHITHHADTPPSPAAGTGVTSRKSRTGPTSRIRYCNVDDITPSPENNQLYRPVDPTDPEIRRLAESITAQGILEPLVISKDGFILSGHRRYCAACLAGLRKVPCRIAPVCREDDPDEFLRLLREHNRQRTKSLDEVVREEVVDVNAEDAYERLLSHRAVKSHVCYPKMDLGRRKSHKRISSAKMPLLSAVLRIIEEMRPYWPIGLRTIHYKLLNDPPLRHASKSASVYANDRQSAKDLSDLCTRARRGRSEDRTIPRGAIGDETRPVMIWNTWPSSRPFVREQFDGFLRGYWRDLQQSQPNHIELFAEKNTIAPILKPVASEFCVPMTSGRGYSSVPPQEDMAERWEQSGKDKLILLIVSDFDPDGERIAEFFARTMRDDFEVPTHPIKIGLTCQQTIDLGLPHGMDVECKNSTNKEWFQRMYGDALAYEVDALEADVLQSMVRNVIRSVMDMDAYNAEVEAEKADAAHLEVLRQRAVRLIGDCEAIE